MQFSTLADTLPIFIIVLNEKNIITYINTAANNLFIPNNKLINKPYADIGLPPIDLLSPAIPHVLSHVYQTKKIEVAWHLNDVNENSVYEKIIYGINITEEANLKNKIDQLCMQYQNEYDSVKKIALKVWGAIPSGPETISDLANDVCIYLENIIAQIPGCVLWWKDHDFKYLGCNDYCSELVGLSSREEMIGLSDEDLEKKFNFPHEVFESWRASDIKALSGEPILLSEEVPWKNREGKTIYQLSNRVPLYDKNKNIIGVLGLALDIAERKQLEFELLEAKERAEASDSAKTLFMENMSHDFKTPLNGIYGVVQLLSMRKEELAEDLQELINVQEKSVARLKRLIDSILDYNKLQAGKVEIHHEELNLLDIIESVVHNLSYLLKDKEISLNINYPLDVPRHLISDSYCVTSVILNLMSNAVKFTHEGHVAISIKALSKNEKNIILQITVEDTGKGIPPDKLEQIFDRFHRLDLSNKGLTEGHGIGLAVVKELVHKLNGDISVESTEGKGTTFKVNLPFEVLNMAFFVSEWKRKHPDVRILLVNDKDANTMSENFGSNSVVVKSKNTINELLSAQRANNPYQIIIVDDDIELSEPLELITIILNIQEIPRLMWLLSSRPKDKEWYDKARAQGYFDFIIKPILPSELDEKLTTSWEEWKKIMYPDQKIS